MPWEHFAHEADMGVRGLGASIEEAYEQAAVALMNIIVDPKTITPQETIEIRLTNPDPELLLTDWLNALVYEMATRNMVFSRFEVRISGADLHAKIQGEEVDVGRHQPTVEVKGATYTALKVAQDARGRWVAQCVVDV